MTTQQNILGDLERLAGRMREAGMPFVMTAIRETEYGTHETRTYIGGDDHHVLDCMTASMNGWKESAHKVQ